MTSDEYLASLCGGGGSSSAAPAPDVLLVRRAQRRRGGGLLKAVLDLLRVSVAAGTHVCMCGFACMFHVGVSDLFPLFFHSCSSFFSRSESESGSSSKHTHKNARVRGEKE
jgi:hypothetical protein